MRSSYIGMKKVTKVIPLGARMLTGYEIRFEDAEGTDGAVIPQYYKRLQDAIVKLSPNLQVNISRSAEGIISILAVGIADDTERNRVLNEAQNEAIHVLESGYICLSLEDICTEFSRTADPWIKVRRSGDVNCDAIDIRYHKEEIEITPHVINRKTELINNAAAEAFKCIAEGWRSNPEEISVLVNKRQYVVLPDTYGVYDAVREIVEMLEASCPKNRHYNPNYYDNMMKI